jgi:SAM-dependent methyltransferase
MNDRTFDEATARQWIRGIESGNSRVRQQDIYPRLSAWVERLAPARLLEIGCGQGVCSDNINLAGRHYTGVDPSSFLILRAKELHLSDHRQFLCGNAYGLPFPAGQFEAAFSVMVWHLLSDLQKAALELGRVLKPAGRFLVITANPAAYQEWAALYINKKIEGRRFEGDMQLEGKTVDHDVLYFHTLDDIVNSLRLAQLEVASIEPFRKSNEGQAQEYLISIEGWRTSAII